MCHHHGPAVGVVIDGHARAAHAALFDHAVGRVVDELEALAVLVDQGLNAVGRVVGQGDRALFGVLAGNELATCIKRETGVLAQGVGDFNSSSQLGLQIG